MRDLGMVMDSTPPAIVSHAVDLETSQRITFDFSESVAANLDLSAFSLSRIANGTSTPIDASMLRLRYDANSNRAMIDFPAGTLADGRYVLSVSAPSVTDLAGNAMTFDDQVVFNVLAGDANGDGHVNFADLVVLAQNYNLPGKTFSQGNFNYSPDGKVDFVDLVILAQNYNATAPVSATAIPAKRGKGSVAQDVL